MNNLRQVLLDAYKNQSVVEIIRSPDPSYTTSGFIVGQSQQFLLIHVFSNEKFLNGYTVVDISDIDQYRISDEHSFMLELTKLRKLLPRPIKINLSSLREFFTSLTNSFPLVCIHTERIDDEVCFIGKIVEQDEDTVTILEISTKAKWDGYHKFNYDDITRIDFGGGYERALMLVATKEAKDDKKLIELLEEDKTFQF